MTEPTPAMIDAAAQALWNLEPAFGYGQPPTYAEYIAETGPRGDVWRARAQVALRAAVKEGTR